MSPPLRPTLYATVTLERELRRKVLDPSVSALLGRERSLKCGGRLIRERGGRKHQSCGSRRTCLATLRFSPGSPDGAWVAFTWENVSGQPLLIARTNGSDVRQVPGAFRFSGQPDWGPDAT